MADLRHHLPPAEPVPPGRYGRDGTPGVVVRRIVPFAAATLAARRGGAARLIAAADALGLALPDGPRAVPGTWGTTAVGIDPDRWLLVTDGPATSGRHAGLPALAQNGGVLVEQSDGLVLLEVSGTAARAALAKGVALDLHPDAFTEGCAAATAVAQVALTLWRTGDAADGTPAFRFAVPRSFVPAFSRWLVQSAAEFGVAFDEAEGAALT